MSFIMGFVQRLSERESSDSKVRQCVKLCVSVSPETWGQRREPQSHPAVDGKHQTCEGGVPGTVFKQKDKQHINTSTC